MRGKRTTFKHLDFTGLLLQVDLNAQLQCDGGL